MAFSETEQSPPDQLASHSHTPSEVQLQRQGRRKGRTAGGAGLWGRGEGAARIELASMQPAIQPMPRQQVKSFSNKLCCATHASRRCHNLLWNVLWCATPQPAPLSVSGSQRALLRRRAHLPCPLQLCRQRPTLCTVSAKPSGVVGSGLYTASSHSPLRTAVERRGAVRRGAGGERMSQPA